MSIEFEDINPERITELTPVNISSGEFNKKINDFMAFQRQVEPDIDEWELGIRSFAIVLKELLE